jgi:hypothetical protein
MSGGSGGIILTGGGGGNLLTLNGKLALESRLQKPISNWFNRSPTSDGHKLRVREYQDKYPDEIHRPVEPSSMYNCHGLTFAARRTGINKHDHVKQILAEDDYKPIGSGSPIFAGDVAIYLEKSEIVHSGIVAWVCKKTGDIWILSKWGEYHEAIHRPLNCPYPQCTVNYYRLEK